jgi:hypothetical protein
MSKHAFVTSCSGTGDYVLSVQTDIRKVALLMSLVIATYDCEQLISLTKNAKSRTRSCLGDKHLEGSIKIATTEIKPDIEM